MELIITTKEELAFVVQDAIKDLITTLPAPVKSETSWLSVDEAVILVNENGLKMAKGTLYVLTHKGEIPYHKFGQQVVFDKIELLTWISARPQRRDKTTNANQAVAASARRKIQYAQK